MPSPELFQKILDAYYEAEFANPSEQAARTEFLEKLIDQAIAGTCYSRTWFIELMKERYRKYRSQRKQREGIPHSIIEGKEPDVRN